MKNSKKTPIMYEVVFDKLVKYQSESKSIGNGMTFKEMEYILSVIFHIPKNLHYNVVREFEELGLVKITKGKTELIGKE